MSIPKTIHYCWFGRDPKPKRVIRSIQSWKKHCPDYRIIEWNEDNFAISDSPLYVRQAYGAKKWAFVTDYARLKVVYDHGGIYLDTDVEILKPIDALLEYEAYFGFEEEAYINTGLGFGAAAGNELLREMMAVYDTVPFLLEDGSYDLTPCPQRNTSVLVNHGLIPNGKFQILDHCAVLPQSWLCPMDCHSGWKRITKDTLSIHHFSASWMDEQQRQFTRDSRKRRRHWRVKEYVIHIPNRIGRKLLGVRRYEKLKQRIKIHYSSREKERQYAGKEKNHTNAV